VGGLTLACIKVLRDRPGRQGINILASP